MRGCQLLPNDSLKRILYIDLSRRRYRTEEREKLFDTFIGGAGVASQLLMENCPDGTDPLSPDNPIVLAVGPLTGLYPLASKTVAMFKSPLTGNLGESHCGGRSAVSIRLAGYGAIVITGSSDRPVYLSVHGSIVRFQDASTLWGMGSGFTVGRVIRENEPAAGLRTIMRIGRAGENLVSYACVTTETYRHFGRLGLGAVFGSKKLKALVVAGRQSLPVTDRKQYRSVYDEIYTAAVESDLMKKYHDLGTAGNILPLNEMGALPTNNLQYNRSEFADQLSGDKLAERYLGRRLACSHCPVGCIHLASIREPYENEPYFYKTNMVCYDYEPIYAIGSLLGGSNTEGMLKLMDEIEKVGLDVMSTGVVLAWATEGFEKRLISESDTGGVILRWGDYAAYINAVKAISSRRGELYDTMARGVEFASSRYGGADFALSFGGNEMPGYHTGPAAHIGYLVGLRHSHLDNAGYSIDQKNAGKSPLSPEDLADKIVVEESWRQILSSLVICFFARGIYTEPVTCRALETAGMSFSEKELKRAGAEIYRRKLSFKLQSGFEYGKLRIPERILETETPLGNLESEYIRATIAHVEKYQANSQKMP